MLVIKKDEFFSFKNNYIDPKFLEKIEYVNFNIDDNSVILRVVENNKQIIRNNILVNKRTKKKPVIISSFSKKTSEIMGILNKLTNITFNRLTVEILDILVNYPSELIETELCCCFYNRIVDEYKYSKMYASMVKKIKDNSNLGLIFSEHLNDLLINKFSEYTNLFINNEDNAPQRKKFTGLVLFMSHLYNFDLFVNLEELIEKITINNVNEIYIEIICKILSVSGKYFSKNYKNYLLNQQSKLNKSSRIYFEIQNIIEFQDSKWQNNTAFLNQVADQQIQSLKTPEVLILKYKDNSLFDLKGVPCSAISEFLEKILDYTFEKKESDIISLSKFCKENIENNITKNVLKEINVSELQLDIPDIQSKINLFKEIVN